MIWGPFRLDHRTGTAYLRDLVINLFGGATMRSLRSRLPGHTTVAAYLALFIALATGGAYAATELGKNDVRSKHIKNGQVKGKDLANDAVTSPKVANGSLLGEDFAAGQLPQGPRGPAGATNVTVRDNVLVGAISGTAECLAGERAVGGGVEGTGLSDFVWRSRPFPQTGTPTGWEGGIEDANPSATTTNGRVYVVCASP